MRLIVSIPTTNRPAIVSPSVMQLAHQERLPDIVLLVIADPDDVDADGFDDLPFPVEIIQSPRGTTVQRNAALEYLRAGDIALFLDDDFVMAPDFLDRTAHLFDECPDVAMATGTVLADGIHGPGIAMDAALDIIATAPPSQPQDIREIYNCYGCNMVVRGDIARLNNIRFDDRLKLYGWLEDVDFSRQMAAHGRIVQSGGLRGVHMGTKQGRSGGLHVGYAQVANPVYLTGKGTMSRKRALNIMGRNLASNLVKSLRPEPEIDRFGRFRGNMFALRDMLLGRMTPERVLRYR